jgi:micrococcal nuclease
LIRRLIDLAAGAVFGAAAATATLLWSGPAAEAVRPAAETAAPSSRSFEARSLGIVDGDTFEARIAAFPGQELVARIRVAGVDAPETRGRCGAETVAAEAAKEALERIVERRRLTLTEVRGDKYFGRVVARVSAAGVGDVAEALVAAGHGRAYAGGKRAGWCG